MVMIGLVNVEQLAEWELAGETEILGESLNQCRKSYMAWREIEPGATVEGKIKY
jgi:hypothetical protein